MHPQQKDVPRSPEATGNLRTTPEWSWWFLSRHHKLLLHKQTPPSTQSSSLWEGLVTGNRPHLIQLPKTWQYFVPQGRGDGGVQTNGAFPPRARGLTSHLICHLQRSALWLAFTPCQRNRQQLGRFLNFPSSPRIYSSLAKKWRKLVSSSAMTLLSPGAQRTARATRALELQNGIRTCRPV